MKIKQNDDVSKYLPIRCQRPMNFNGFFFFLEKFAVVFNYKILTA